MPVDAGATGREHARMKPRPGLIRNLEGGHYLDIFLVSAVSAVLVIRFLLKVTDYPRLSPGSLHIAHVLWGGLLMMVAIVVLLSYLGRGGLQFAALLGGLGFGAFIDEVGKFVTEDNDYFYRPAAAVIYVVFVLTYLGIRSIHREQLGGRREYLVNAVELMKRLPAGSMSAEERDQALQYLARADSRDPLVAKLRHILFEAELAPASGPGLYAQCRDGFFAGYRRLTALRGFTAAVITFFVMVLVVKVAQAALLIFAEHVTPHEILRIGLLQGPPGERSASAWGQLVASMISALFIAAGVVSVRKSRLTAFRMFQRSVLVSIFLTQVFMFYREQWAALAGLVFNILVFLALHFMIERERSSTWKGH